LPLWRIELLHREREKKANFQNNIIEKKTTNDDYFWVLVEVGLPAKFGPGRHTPGNHPGYKGNNQLHYITLH
jgi:hypothetical protein